MTSLEQILGIDLTDPETLLAIELVKADHDLLRELVALRRKHKLNQEDVAERLGVSQPTVSAFERLDNDPKLSTIRRYAQAVGAVVKHEVTSHPQYAAAVGGWITIHAKVAPVVTSTGPAAEQVQVEADRADFALAA